MSRNGFVLPVDVGKVCISTDLDDMVSVLPV